MFIELIANPGTEIWYGLVDYEPFEEEVEYEEPEFSSKTRRIRVRISDFKNKSRD